MATKAESVHLKRPTTALHASIKSPVNQTQDCDCCHLDKGTDNVRSLGDELCGCESQKPTRCVHFAVHICMCESLILSCTLHAFTKSPVNQTQDCDCCHLDKGTDNVRSLGDELCGCESQKPMRCVHFAVHVRMTLCESYS